MDRDTSTAAGDRLVLRNGRLLVPERSATGLVVSSSTAMLVADGTIVAIGGDELPGPGDLVVDLQGATVAPGFVDPHVHAFDCAMNALIVSCLPPSVGTLREVGDRLAERARSLPLGSWVVGAGYDDARLRERRHPTRVDLDGAVPDHPVFLTRVCGHMSVTNSRALELAGIDVSTPDPEGGSIVRDAAGRPTGLLLERAQSLVKDVLPAADDAAIAAELGRMGPGLLARGITTIGEALLGAFHPRETDLWREAFEGGWTGPDVMFLAAPDLLEAQDVSDLPVIGTKLFADGVVTGRTASVSEPFEGSDELGILIHEPQALTALVAASVRRGLPVGIHAMGDRGIQIAIGSILAGGEGSRLQRRHRIEHCTLPSPEVLEMMRTGGIVPVPQPVFLFAEGEAYLDSLGTGRCARAYPLRSMLRRGLSPALSSDAPATSWEDPLDPWLGVVTAATRRTWAGSVLGEDEAITVAEALASYTLSGARVLGVEERTGSIEVGKDADLIVLADDPLALPTTSLPGMRPVAVLRRGRVVHGGLG